MKIDTLVALLILAATLGGTGALILTTGHVTARAVRTAWLLIIGGVTIAVVSLIAFVGEPIRRAASVATSLALSGRSRWWVLFGLGLGAGLLARVPIDGLVNWKFRQVPPAAVSPEERQYRLDLRKFILSPLADANLGFSNVFWLLTNKYAGKAGNDASAPLNTFAREAVQNGIQRHFYGGSRVSKG